MKFLTLDTVCCPFCRRVILVQSKGGAFYIDHPRMDGCPVMGIYRVTPPEIDCEYIGPSTVNPS